MTKPTALQEAEIYAGQYAMKSMQLAARNGFIEGVLWARRNADPNAEPLDHNVRALGDIVSGLVARVQKLEMGDE